MKFNYTLLFCLTVYCVKEQTFNHTDAENNIFKYGSYQKKLRYYFITALGRITLQRSNIPSSIINLYGDPEYSFPTKSWVDTTVNLNFLIGAECNTYTTQPWRKLKEYFIKKNLKKF